MTRAELQRLARLGAEARLAELDRERQLIYQTFPDLRSSSGNPYTAGVRRAVAGVPDAIAGAVPRRRPKLSREARQRIAEAQRKRWAALRAQNGQVTEQKPESAEAPKPSGGGSRKRK